MKIYLLTLFCLFFSCSSKENKKSPSEQLVGEWRNVYMKVEMQTVNNTDSNDILEVSEENWEKMMQIRTIQTFYNADGTYNSKHTNLKDSVIYNPAGKWQIQGDSIIMSDTFPKTGLIYKYKIAIKDNNVEFWGVEDFDQDGNKDDKYYGTQKRQ